MSLLILYLATALVFLALDVVMLKRVLHPLFSKHIGHMMLDAPKWEQLECSTCFMWLV